MKSLLIAAACLIAAPAVAAEADPSATTPPVAAAIPADGPLAPAVQAVAPPGEAAPATAQATDAAAHDPTSDLNTYDNAKGWIFSFGPYGWGVAVNGDVASFGQPVTKVHQSRGSLLKDLNYGVMLSGELRHDRFSVWSDLFYVKISYDVASPFPADVSTRELMWSSGVGYRVLQTDNIGLDVMGGARVWSLENKAKVTAGPFTGLALKDKHDWTDPFIGARLHASLSRRLYFLSWAQVGGFDVGSKSMWDIQGGLGYRLSARASVLGGYRALGVNYRDNGFVYDIVKQGPYVGAIVHF